MNVIRQNQIKEISMEEIEKYIKVFKQVLSKDVLSIMTLTC